MTKLVLKIGVRQIMRIGQLVALLVVLAEAQTLLEFSWVDIGNLNENPEGFAVVVTLVVLLVFSEFVRLGRLISIPSLVWIGFIALLGIATDTGVVLATYLAQRFRQNPPASIADVHERTIEAGLRRVRPCLMTTATTALALLPVITSHGRGADIMAPMALPSIGGMLTILLTLFVVPVLYAAVQERRLRRGYIP